MSPFFTLLALVAYYLYFVHRIMYTVRAQRQFGKVYAMAWLFIVSEALIAGKISALLRLFYTDPF